MSLALVRADVETVYCGRESWQGILEKKKEKGIWKCSHPWRCYMIMLLQDFRTFMSNKAEQAGHSIVPTETLNKILDFLPQLLSFNEMLLKDLTDRIANWSVVVVVVVLQSSSSSSFFFFFRLNPLGPRPATVLSLQNLMWREVTVSNDPSIQLEKSIINTR